ncbi:MAG: hypothetical protein WCX65_12940, partial [bacterium]
AAPAGKPAPDKSAEPAPPPSLKQEAAPAGHEPASDSDSTGIAAHESPQPEKAEASQQPAPPPPQQQAPKYDETPSDLKDILHESFMEMTRILVGRLNALDVSTSLTELKKELAGIMSADSDDDESEEAGAANPIELIIEEKIKQYVSGPLDELKSEIGQLKEAIIYIAGSAASQAAPEVNVAPPDLAPLNENISAIENRINAQIAALAERVANIPLPSVEPIRSAVGDLSATMESLAGKIPSRDDIRKQFGDYNSLLEERSGALHKIYMVELERGMTEIRKQITSNGPEVEEAMNGLQKSFASELERITKIFSKGLDSAQTAFVAPPAPDYGKLENSIQGFIEDFRDQFATQLSVELNESNMTRESAAEKRYLDALNSRLEPFRQALAETAPLENLLNSKLGVVENNLKSNISELISRQQAQTDEFREKLHEVFSLFGGVRDTLDRIGADAQSAAKPDFVAAKIDELSGRIAGIQNELAGSLDSKLIEISGASTEAANSLSPRLDELFNRIDRAQSEISSAFELKAVDSAAAAYTTVNSIIPQIEELKKRLEQTQNEVIGKLEAKVTESAEAAAGAASSLIPHIEELKNQLGLQQNEIFGKLETKFIQSAETAENAANSLIPHIEALKNQLGLQQNEIVNKLEAKVVESAEAAAGAANSLIPHVEELFKRVDRSQSAIVETLETKLAQGVDSTTQTNNAVQELFRKLDNKLIEIRELHASTEGELDQIRKTILDEVRSFSGSTLKPEDIMIVREWIQEMIPELRIATADKASEALREAIEEFKAAAAQTKTELDSVGGALGHTRDDIKRMLGEYAADLKMHLVTGIEAGREGFAGVKDIEDLRDRVEERLGDVVDDFASRVETRLDQRDRYYEEGVQSIIHNLEKVLSRGTRLDFENLFSGGGLISNLFSGQKSESPMKLTGKTAPQAPSSHRDGADPQIKRFAYLLGKRINKEITDADGETLACAGDIVDDALVRLMRDKNRTLELIRAVDFKD